jgi:hypothetical protein
MVAGGLALGLMAGSSVAVATPVGGDFRISGSKAAGREWNPAVAYNAKANKDLVAWQDTRNLVARGHDIFGRRVAG